MGKGRHRQAQAGSRIGAKGLLGAATAAMAVIAIPATTASAAPSSQTPQITPHAPHGKIGTQSAGSGGRSGTFDDDRYQDILARQKSNGILKVYPHADSDEVGTGTFTAAQQILGDTRGFRWIGQGDFNGDGYADVAGITPDGRLNIALNKGGGYQGPSNTLGTAALNSRGWNSTDLVFTGDVDGDGRDDIMARRSGTNSTYAYLNTATTGDQPVFAAPKLLATTASGVIDQQLVDITNDNQPDLVSIKSNGEIYVKDYADPDANGNPRNYLVGTGYNTNNAFLFNDLNGDNQPDLVARTSTGTLRGFLHGEDWDKANPLATFGQPVTLGSGWNSNDVIS